MAVAGDVGFGFVAGSRFQAGFARLRVLRQPCIFKQA
jgi:hypothetical protein